MAQLLLQTNVEHTCTRMKASDLTCQTQKATRSKRKKKGACKASRPTRALLTRTYMRRAPEKAHECNVSRLLFVGRTTTYTPGNTLYTCGVYLNKQQNRGRTNHEGFSVSAPCIVFSSASDIMETMMHNSRIRTPFRGCRYARSRPTCPAPAACSLQCRRAPRNGKCCTHPSTQREHVSTPFILALDPLPQLLLCMLVDAITAKNILRNS